MTDWYIEDYTTPAQKHAEEPAKNTVLAEHEMFGELGGYPTILDPVYFIHQGRLKINSSDHEEVSERFYQADNYTPLVFQDD